MCGRVVARAEQGNFHRRIWRRLLWWRRCVARPLPKRLRRRVFLPDTGMRYLSKVYSDEWMRERGYVQDGVPLRAEEVVAAKKRSGKSRDLIVARPFQTVFHALHAMQQQDISQLPVFDDAPNETSIVGTISEDQILSLALQGKDLRKLVIREVMSEALPQVARRRAGSRRITYLMSHETLGDVYERWPIGHYEILTKYDLMGTHRRS